MAEPHICTVGVDHDVTSWFKPLEEYCDIEREWFDGGEQDSEVFGVAEFFTWLFDSLQCRKQPEVHEGNSPARQGAFTPGGCAVFLETTRFFHGIRRSDRS